MEAQETLQKITDIAESIEPLEDSEKSSERIMAMDNAIQEIYVLATDWLDGDL